MWTPSPVESSGFHWTPLDCDIVWSRSAEFADRDQTMSQSVPFFHTTTIPSRHRPHRPRLLARHRPHRPPPARSTRPHRHAPATSTPRQVVRRPATSSQLDTRHVDPASSFDTSHVDTRQLARHRPRRPRQLVRHRPRRHAPASSTPATSTLARELDNRHVDARRRARQLPCRRVPASSTAGQLEPATSTPSSTHHAPPPPRRRGTRGKEVRGRGHVTDEAAGLPPAASFRTCGDEDRASTRGSGGYPAASFASVREGVGDEESRGRARRRQTRQRGHHLLPRFVRARGMGDEEGAGTRGSGEAAGLSPLPRSHLFYRPPPRSRRTRGRRRRQARRSPHPPVSRPLPCIPPPSPSYRSHSCN